MALGGSKKADLREQTARTCCTRTLHVSTLHSHTALANMSKNKMSTRVGRHLTLPAREFRTILTSHTNTYIRCNANAHKAQHYTTLAHKPLTQVHKIQPCNHSPTSSYNTGSPSSSMKARSSPSGYSTSPAMDITHQKYTYENTNT